MSETPDQQTDQQTDQPTDQPTADAGDLGPMPTPAVEPGEPAPGGPDALEREGADDPVPADLPTGSNPAVDTASTPELAEGEDTSTQATRDGEAEVDAEEESPA